MSWTRSSSVPTLQVGTSAISGSPICELQPVRFPIWKRVFDIVAATALLLFIAPLVAVVAMLVALDGGPVIFGHARIGTHGRLFRVLKFRTMAVDAEEKLHELLKRDPATRAEWELTQKLRNDPRITPIGRFLRKSSIDELPQIWNVLRGEMSIVGPRPIVHAEVIRYGRYISHYKITRPGITGLWQVNGRNDVSYRRRVALDTLYCRKGYDIYTDVKIVLKTIPALLFSKGSY
jgi:lipopolysaccharide/colanic/teichoic acid biosynthesis glycosyltransferase